MIPGELLQPDHSRVRWLFSVSRDEREAFCAAAAMDDPIEVHCARFCVHLVEGIPLPVGYAWAIMQRGRHATDWALLLHQRQAHLLTMALYAADLDAVRPDPREWFKIQDLWLPQAVFFRFAHAPKALDDAALVELSVSDDEPMRHAVARLLQWRASDHRREIVLRLMEDPSRRVARAAHHTAVYSGDPVLLADAAERENMWALVRTGDPRARAHSEALLGGDDPCDWELGLGMAFGLRDLGLLADACQHSDWDTRRNAILGCAHGGMLDACKLDEYVSGEPVEHLAELMVRWPDNRAEMLTILWRVLEGRTGVPVVATSPGTPVPAKQAWSMMRNEPMVCGALARLLPVDEQTRVVSAMLAAAESDVRRIGVEVVAGGAMKQLFPALAEMLLDSSEPVIQSAQWTIHQHRVRCGIYGLDTAILRAGDQVENGGMHRWILQQLMEAVLQQHP